MANQIKSGLAPKTVGASSEILLVLAHVCFQFHITFHYSKFLVFVHLDAAGNGNFESSNGSSSRRVGGGDGNDNGGGGSAGGPNRRATRRRRSDAKRTSAVFSLQFFDLTTTSRLL